MMTGTHTLSRSERFCNYDSDDDILDITMTKDNTKDDDDGDDNL